MKKALFILVLIALAAAWFLYEPPVPDFGRKVLVFSRTTEYRHDSIGKGIETLTELGRRGRFNVVASEDPALFHEDTLPQFHAIVFLNTTGDVLDDARQEAMQRYIQAGGGFVGIHAAADTEWREDPWYWYQRLVGGVFNGHPKDSDQRATLTVLDNTHPATAALPASWEASDEWYDYKRLSDGINVLMTVDEATYEGGQMGEAHPITWYREFDGGRSFYTGLGHTESTYDNEQFQQMLLGALDWAMGDGALDYSRAGPESWRFSRVVLDSNLNEPVKITFSPEGELYFLERRGALKRYDVERQRSVTVAEVPNFNEFESGMLGVAFDPGFTENRWVYLYRSTPREDPTLDGETVLSRFKLDGDDLDLASEQRLLAMESANSETSRAAHAGGDMQFDAAGNLWLSTGDDTAAADHGRIDDRPGQRPNDAARSAANTNDLRGKILRITPRAEANEAGLLYDIPAGNLFPGGEGGRAEIYAMGLRNPFTIAFDDRTGTLYWGEVGPDGREPNERGPMGFDEVNRTREAGNFGWPYVIADRRAYHYFDHDMEEALDKVDVERPENRSRNNTGARFLPPAQTAWIYYPYAESERFFEFGSGGRNALVGHPFYSEDYADSDVKFPAWLDGKLIVGEFMRNWLKVVSTDAQGNIETIMPLIEHKFSAPLDMAFGPDGSLYVVEYGSSWFQQNPDAYLSRIEYYDGDNPPPVAVVRAARTEGAAPMTLALDGTASYDRGRDSMIARYQWRLLAADGTATGLGEGARLDTVIDAPGDYQLELTVTDDGELTHSALVGVVVGNERPEVAIDVSGNRSFFRPGQSLDYTVRVTDLEDGSTDKGSITADDVQVRFDYLGESEDLARVLAGHRENPLLAGRALVTRGSDCHGCHQVDAESMGPSFTAIGERYAGQDDASALVQRAIAEGGSGNWPGNHAMPGHPALTQAQLAAASRYILSLGGAGGDGKSGLAPSGTLEFTQHEADRVVASIDTVVEVELGEFYPGRYLLHASYADRGGDAPALQGNADLVLYHPRQRSGFLTAGPGAMKMDVSDTVSLAIIQPGADDVETFAYAYAEDIDLTGVSSVTVAAAALMPFFAGGPLELRLDDPASEPVARGEIETSLGYDEEKGLLTLDVSAVEGVHTLLFGAPRDPGSDPDKPPYAIVGLEFAGPGL